MTNWPSCVELDHIIENLKELYYKRIREDRDRKLNQLLNEKESV